MLTLCDLGQTEALPRDSGSPYLSTYLPTYFSFLPSSLPHFFPSFFSFSFPATYVFKNITMVVEMFSVFGAVGSPGQLGLPHYPKLHHLLILYREQRGEIQI